MSLRAVWEEVAVPGVLRLEAREHDSPARWRWVLTDDVSRAFIADHEVRLDESSWQYDALCFPYLMTGIISTAPGERAGSAASLAQTANELGIALGLVVLGSVGSLVCRADLRASAGHADGTWVDGLREAAGSHDAALLHQVRDAFTTGFHTAAMVALALMIVVLALRSKIRRQ